jgi:hypothetical protein
MGIDMADERNNVSVVEDRQQEGAKDRDSTAVENGG